MANCQKTSDVRPNASTSDLAHMASDLEQILRGTNDPLFQDNYL